MHSGEVFLAVQNFVGSITKDVTKYVLSQFHIYLCKHVGSIHEASGFRDSNETVNIGKQTEARDRKLAVLKQKRKTDVK